MDPIRNLVRFRVKGEVLEYAMPAWIDGGLRKAWRRATEDRPALTPAAVRAVRSLWGPAADDTAFLREVLPRARYTYRWDRPEGTDGWSAALAAARADLAEHPDDPEDDEPEEDGVDEPGDDGVDERLAAESVAAALDEMVQAVASVGITPSGADDDGFVLLPVLLSEPDERLGPMIEQVPGRLYASFGMHGPTERGTTLWRHAPHEDGEVAGVSAQLLLIKAATNLAGGLVVRCTDKEPNKDSLLEFSRDGGNAGAALTIPGFGARQAELLGAERIVVGVPCNDVCWVAGEGSPAADRVYELVREHTHTDYLVPAVYLIDRDDRIEVLDSVGEAVSRPQRQIMNDGHMFATFNPICPEQPPGTDEIALSELWPRGADR